MNANIVRDMIAGESQIRCETIWINIRKIDRTSMELYI